MKRNSIAVAAVTLAMFVSGATIGIASAQTTPAAHAADEIATMGASLTTLQRVDTQRLAIMSSTAGGLTALAGQAIVIANSPLATAQERAAVSQDIMSLDVKLHDYADIIVGLQGVLGGEVAMLASMQNSLTSLAATVGM